MKKRIYKVAALLITAAFFAAADAHAQKNLEAFMAGMPANSATGASPAGIGGTTASADINPSTGSDIDMSDAGKALEIGKMQQELQETHTAKTTPLKEDIDKYSQEAEKLGCRDPDAALSGNCRHVLNRLYTAKSRYAGEVKLFGRQWTKLEKRRLAIEKRRGLKDMSRPLIYRDDLSALCPPSDSTQICKSLRITQKSMRSDNPYRSYMARKHYYDKLTKLSDTFEQAELFFAQRANEAKALDVGVLWEGEPEVDSGVGEAVAVPSKNSEYRL